MRQWRRVIAAFLTLVTLVFAGCADDDPTPQASDAVAQQVALAQSELEHRSLASFTGDGGCYDRDREPYTSVVDSHLHFQPFGGLPVPFTEMLDYLNRTGVRFANVYGIGQSLPADSTCTYYLDCKGTPASPSLRNDMVNAENIADYKPTDVHLTLSMTFPDLAKPGDIIQKILLLDKEYPGMFRWVGEVNLVKQALFGNGHEAVPVETIQEWSGFMSVLSERNIPIAIHSDLGSDAEPTKYVAHMEEVLSRYPENRIVWMHMGLSRELTKMDPQAHIALMRQFLDQHPNLSLDISWRVIQDAYFERPETQQLYVNFFNEYSTRILPGTDFVAAVNKDFDTYAEELEVTSRINKSLNDESFRNIALGQNYFELLGLDYKAPQVCP